MDIDYRRYLQSIKIKLVDHICGHKYGVKASYFDHLKLHTWTT
jgi:hypothetical protein